MNFASEAPRLRALGDLRADADHDARARLRSLTCSISARSSSELYMSARTPRKTGAKIETPIAGIALGRRHEDGLVGDRARAVPRVVVAVAEKHEEIEVVLDAPDVADRAPGSLGPSLSSHCSSSAIECGCSKTMVRPAPEIVGVSRRASPGTGGP